MRVTDFCSILVGRVATSSLCLFAFASVGSASTGLTLRVVDK